MDPHKPDLDEKDLVARAKTDPAAFGEIFDTYYDRILVYALKRTGDSDVALDITAEVFAKALKNLRWFTWRGIPLSAWLYRIAGNEINMYFRKKKYSTASLNTLIEAGYDPSEDSLSVERRELEEMLERSEDEKRMRIALNSLTPAQQELIAIRYFEGLRTREIALLFKKPEGTVRSLLSRAISELRRVYESNLQQKPESHIIGNEGRSGLLLQVTEL